VIPQANLFSFFQIDKTGIITGVFPDLIRELDGRVVAFVVMFDVSYQAGSRNAVLPHGQGDVTLDGTV